MKITVKPGLEMGDDCPPFIIAEVGSNWTCIAHCLHSIETAKECGADAVKFQLYDKVSLYGFWHHPPHFSEIDLLPGQLPLEWLPTLKTHADIHGIEFMCSAFSPDLVEAVNPFVNIHKVASAEMTHVRILEKLRKLGKPVILSTGASGEGDISASLGMLEHSSTILMYCVAAYPAQEIDLGTIPALKSRFGALVGYSDHSTDVLALPSHACALGACAIEKHFTALPQLETPDRGHSLTPSQFARMVESIRGSRAPRIGWTREEQPMISRHNRRLIATRDIAQGERLVEGENFGIYRSLKDDHHAWTPFMVDRVNGETALKPILAGDGIGPGDV